MKNVINTAYTFTPASRTVDLSSITSFNIQNLYAIINETTSTIIYAAGTSGLGYSNVSSGVVTLVFNTTSMNASDKLTIIYDNVGYSTINSKDYLNVSLASGVATGGVSPGRMNIIGGIDGSGNAQALSQDASRNLNVNLAGNSLTGIKTMANSIPVVVASDQEAINVTTVGILAPQTSFALTSVGNTVVTQVTPGLRYSFCTQIPVNVSGGTFSVIFESSPDNSTWSTITTAIPKTLVGLNAVVSSGIISAIGLWSYYAPATVNYVRLRLTALSGLTQINAFIDDLSSPNSQINLPYVAGLTANMTTGQDFIPKIDMLGLGPITIDVQALAGSGQTLTWRQSNDPSYTTPAGLLALNNSAAMTVATTATGVGVYQLSPSTRYFSTSLTFTTITSMIIGGVSAKVISNVSQYFQGVTNATQISGQTIATSTSGIQSIGFGTAITSADSASGAKTTSGNSGTLTQGNTPSSSWVIPVTAVSGTTPTLDLVLQESWDTGTTWQDVYHIERITGVTQIQTPKITFRGNRYRWVWTITGTTPSFTFSISALKEGGVVGVPAIFSMYDRAAVLTTLNSTSAVWSIAGAKFHKLLCVIGTATTPPVLALDLSDDGTNFWEATTLTTVASSATAVTLANAPAKYARVRVKTIGNTVVANYISYMSTS